MPELFIPWFLAVVATATYGTYAVLNSTVITPVRRSLLISWNFIVHTYSISNSYPQANQGLSTGKYVWFDKVWRFYIIVIHRFIHR